MQGTGFNRRTVITKVPHVTQFAAGANGRLVSKLRLACWHTYSGWQFKVGSGQWVNSYQIFYGIAATTIIANCIELNGIATLLRIPLGKRSSVVAHFSNTITIVPVPAADGTTC